MNILTFARRLATVAAFAATAFAGATAHAVAQSGGGAPDFGSPPSGEVPIYFNDRHVYAKPDELKKNRVLAALIRNGVILVPLRSMFEQMGASVSFDAASKTVDLSKPGADVKVTLGKKVVTINGEDRALDFPPEMYRGVIVVPVRVLSEGMGAFVQWNPERRIVIIRYVATVPATPMPTPVPTTEPTVAPSPSAAPVVLPSTKPTFEVFLAGDYGLIPIVYNEVSPGNTGRNTYEFKGGTRFPLIGANWLLDANYRHVEFPHQAYFASAPCALGTPACNTVNGSDPFYSTGACPAPDPGCTTVIGYQNIQAYNGLSQAYAGRFIGKEDDVDAHFGLQVLEPHTYVGVGYYYKHFNYFGYPNLQGVGFGLSHTPNFKEPVSVYGSVYYYPTIDGTYRYPVTTFLGPLSGQNIKLSYSALKYEGGGTINIGYRPYYIDLGVAGEYLRAKQNAPVSTNVTYPFIGFGAHF